MPHRTKRKAASHAEVENPSDGQREGIGEVVVVVDDEPVIRTTMQRMLERHGYTVFAAEDGAAALNLLEKFSATPDLLITDIVMPEVNGEELVAELGRHGYEPKVLVMSAFDPTVVAKTGFADRYAFLPKPFTREELVSRVHSVIHSA